MWELKSWGAGTGKKCFKNFVVLQVSGRAALMYVTSELTMGFTMPTHMPCHASVHTHSHTHSLIDSLGLAVPSMSPGREVLVEELTLSALPGSGGGVDPLRPPWFCSKSWLTALPGSGGGVYPLCPFWFWWKSWPTLPFLVLVVEFTRSALSGSGGRIDPPCPPWFWWWSWPALPSLVLASFNPWWDPKCTCQFWARTGGASVSI